jgi:hypothetical protein
VTRDDIRPYEEFREAFKPPSGIDVLFIVESPPDRGRGELRYFYNPEYNPPDNLVRAVADAVYPVSLDISARGKKKEVLQWLQDNGYWLVDSVEYPINKLLDQERRRLIRERREEFVNYCVELSPKRGIIICHKRVFTLLALPLCKAGLKVLHDEYLPFPLGKGFDTFVRGVKHALGKV